MQSRYITSHIYIYRVTLFSTVLYLYHNLKDINYSLFIQQVQDHDRENNIDIQP